MCSIHEVENHLQLHNLGYTIGAQASLMDGTHTEATQIRSSFPLKTSKMIYHAPNPNIMHPGPFFLLLSRFMEGQRSPFYTHWITIPSKVH
jgi:hypothetical protein